MAIAQKTLEAIAPFQLRHNRMAHQFDQWFILNRKGRKADNAEQCRIHFLAARLARQHGVQRNIGLGDVVGNDVNDRCLRAAWSKQIKTGQRFQRGFGHAN